MPPEGRANSEGAAGTAVEVRDLEKTFRIPANRVSRLKERMVNPFARNEYRELRALRKVSFDINDGEFFGIVGRNGSGKSTLLKILAGIYAADSGSVRARGRIAPFIELGVGFDMELSARENVVLNGVMMGLSRSESQRRIDEVLDFAELEEFVDLKLKNYSSGMLVRLAFSVMVQADSDTLLIDEVLAVGDAAFQQKCADVFHEMKRTGKTVVLVTHDMGAVEEYCHRAMLLSEGEMVEIGAPSEVARSYLRLNFQQVHAVKGAGGSAGGMDDLRLLDIWLEGAVGARVENVEQGQRIRIRARLEADREVADPLFGFAIANADDLNIHEFIATLPEDGVSTRLRAGERVTISVDADNRLAPGHYYLSHGVSRNGTRGDAALFVPRVLDFVVFGTEGSPAILSVDYETQVIQEGGGR